MSEIIHGRTLEGDEGESQQGGREKEGNPEHLTGHRVWHTVVAATEWMFLSKERNERKKKKEDV